MLITDIIRTFATEKGRNTQKNTFFMITQIEEQAFAQLDEILNNATKMAQTDNENERGILLKAIEDACFKTRTYIDSISRIAKGEDGDKCCETFTPPANLNIDSSTDKGKKKKYVLIAEDVDCNYMLASLVLKKEYRVERAKNGREAVEMVERELPDIVLMDIKMPVMDGYEACEIIKKKYPALPIIAVTAYTQMEEEPNIMKRGFDGFLPKPLNLAAFTKLVSEKVK